jgi:hypothetical protein
MAEVNVPGREQICIGLIADIQYRDTEDVYLEKHGFTRSYRAALPKTVEAVRAFTGRNVPYVLHLGDIIDGRGIEVDREELRPTVLNELDSVLRAVGLLPADSCVLHGTWGVRPSRR